MKKILSTAIASAGWLLFVSIGAFYLFTTVLAEPEKFAIDNEIESPKGEYIAAIYTRSGGGPAGGCQKGVVVYPEEFKGNSREDLIDRWSVFDVGCENKIIIGWSEEDVLYISSDYPQLSKGISISVSNL